PKEGRITTVATIAAAATAIMASDRLIARFKNGR
ncbi:MAG: hypothetical protein RLZZ535_3098, partial [Cyanobacteriota bacterium]